MEAAGKADTPGIRSKRGLLVVQLISKDTGPLKEETEKDYCVKVSESISDVLREILENEDEYNTVRLRLTGIVADGAPSMQKGL